VGIARFVQRSVLRNEDPQVGRDTGEEFTLELDDRPAVGDRVPDAVDEAEIGLDPRLS
jgi:hypothetical protein